MSCRDRLMTLLEKAAAPYQFHHHPRAYTAQEVASREHISGDRFAKVVMLVADNRLAMAVTRANDQVDVQKVARVLAATEVRVAHEREFADIFPDCEVGAMPPFGNLYGVPVVMDRRLAEYEDIVSQAGTHTETIALHFADYERIVHPRVADLAVRA